MLKYNRKALLFCALVVSVIALELKSEASEYETEQKKMVLFVAGRNNSNCYKKNLDSIFAQKYDNYKVIYVDDASTDGTGALVKSYIEERDLQDKVVLILNKERQYKLTNQYNAIHTLCDNKDIVVELDADDWFACDYALSYLNQTYADPKIWLTYGTFTYWPSGKPGYSCDVPEKYRRGNLRDFGFQYAGLRTYYAGLFKLIRKEDLIYSGEDDEFNGCFFPIASDNAIMYALMDMCKNKHFKFIEEVLHICNRDRSGLYSERMRKVWREIEIIAKNMPRYPALKFSLWDFDLSKVMISKLLSDPNYGVHRPKGKPKKRSRVFSCKKPRKRKKNRKNQKTLDMDETKLI